MNRWNQLLILILVLSLPGLGGCGRAPAALPTTLPATLTALSPTATSPAAPTLAATQPPSTQLPVTATLSPTAAPTAAPLVTLSAVQPGNLAALKGLPFKAFVEQSFEILLGRDPEARLTLGLLRPSPQMGACLTDISDDALRQTQSLEVAIKALLADYNRADLTPEQQRTYEVYAWYLDNQVRGHAFVYNNYPVTQMINSVNATLNSIFLEVLPVTSEAEARGYVLCLSQVKTKMEQLVQGLQRRQQNGAVLPRMLFDWFLPDLVDMGRNSGAAHPFYAALGVKLGQVSGLSSEQRSSILEAAQLEFDRSVVPGYQALVEELNRERDQAPADIGVWVMPDGAAYYAFTLHDQTTTDLTADEIHALGLQELKDIQAHMRVIFDKLGYPQDEDLSALYKRVAQGGGQVTGGDIKQRYEDLIRDAELKSKDLFNLQPKVKVIVKDDPTGGYYMPPSLDGSRPGAFFARVTGTEWGYTMPTLAYHEAVPGHHFQLAMVNELNLPLFQKVVTMNGFVEGWALYAERLMWENGAYQQDPYGELGFWQFMARRAARLVVDTGIHSKHWTFQQAVDFMVKNTGMIEYEVQGETGRMAAWPGQATSYFVGYLKILELRQKAKEALGSRFDLKAFHDLVIGGGTMPLSVLEQAMDAYIGKK
jgi:uncharacterized protein (DUF885 family)